MIDIGIPPGAPVHPQVGLIESTVVDGIPRRGRESTKFAAGAVLVCGGSTGLTGAPCLACEAAMRAGAGYVTALVPASLEYRVRAAAAGGDVGAAARRAGGALQPSRRRHDPRARRSAPGRSCSVRAWAATPQTFELARTVAAPAPRSRCCSTPTGSTPTPGGWSRSPARGAGTVLTPHAGELARLLESTAPRSAPIGWRVRARGGRRGPGDRRAQGRRHDRRRARRPGGDQPRRLLGAGHGGHRATSSPGVIGAYLSKRMDPFHAACAGVFVHARAGQLAARADRRRGRDRPRRDRVPAPRAGSAGQRRGRPRGAEG